MKSYLILILNLWVLMAGVYGQKLEGQVELWEDGKWVPAVGASVWVGTQGQITNSEGKFSLPFSSPDTLHVRNAGYREWKGFFNHPNYGILVRLSDEMALDSVTITARVPSTQFSLLDPLPVENLSQRELGKAACCNLGESFETNASVDVSNNDAATGSKEIKLLGLAGRYAQVMTERRPMLRGLGLPYGLNYIPGSWIESIQIAKGVGTVDNGYESITGEINVELIKPYRAPKLFLNLYGNQYGRAEANLISGKKLSSKWSTVLLAHGSMEKVRWDMDSDMFLNNPLFHLVTAENRWQYEGKNGLCGQIGVRGLTESRVGGDPMFNPKRDKLQDSIYGLGVETRRVEAFGKLGKADLGGKPFRSWGTIWSGFFHKMDGYFGQTSYSGVEKNFRFNFNYQDIFGTTLHKWRAGATFLVDDFSEKLKDSVFSRTELVPGVWGEYTYDRIGKMVMVFGVRADYHNLFGAMLTPRLHVRWRPSETTTLRLTAGRGYRTPNAVAENLGVLASQRQWVFSGKPQQEEAWTFGVNGVQVFSLAGREGSLSLEAYHTEFTNRYMANLEDPRKIVLYSLKGGSRSDVVQAEVNWEVLPKLDLRIAGKWQQARAVFDGTWKDVPFTPRAFGLLNLAWESPNGRWIADATLSFTGTQRLPSTLANPLEYRLPSQSPSFVRVIGQVTRKLRKNWEVYLGGENLTNFYQKNPVISSLDPFGPFFDASMAWGPLMGRMAYAGLRFSISNP